MSPVTGPNLLLLEALKVKNLARVRDALSQGADPCMIIGPHGKQPLHVAIEEDMLELAHVLLESMKAHGAVRMPARERVNEPVLVMVATLNHPGACAMAKLLLEMGADPDEASDTHASALGSIAEKGASGEALFKLLVEAGATSLNAGGNRGITPAHRAIAHGDRPEFIAWLLDHGAELEGATSNGATMLQLAAEMGLPKTCQMLLERGANARHVKFDGQTPLHSVMAAPGNQERTNPEGRKTVIDALIAAGADLHAGDIGGYQPIHTGTLSGATELIGHLIALGCDPNAPSPGSGGNLLHLGVFSRTQDKPSLLTYLARKGADVHAVDSMNRTPGKVAADRDQMDCVQALLASEHELALDARVLGATPAPRARI